MSLISKSISISVRHYFISLPSRRCTHFWNTFKFDLSADFAAYHRVNEPTTSMIQEALYIILAMFSLKGGDPYIIEIPVKTRINLIEA